MLKNETETREYLITPALRAKGYDWPNLRMERPAAIDPSGPKGARSSGKGIVDYLICLKDDQGNNLPVGVIEAKAESEDALKGMTQGKGYKKCDEHEVKYVFSTNGHRYGKFNKFTGLQTGPFPLDDFPPYERIVECYTEHSGINPLEPAAKLLFMPDSPAYSEKRYYQDAAIRATFEKILLEEQKGKVARALLSLATGAGKTIIAANMLWRLQQAGRLSKPALFVCDRDELRTQGYNKLKAVFGSDARVVENKNGQNTAKNARVHIATYQTLGIDDESEDFASFLTEHYPENSFSIIIIDECHRSAWGKWSEVLTRNPDAIQIGLTATPREIKPTEAALKDEEALKAIQEDTAITANNLKYFGEPVYEYKLGQAQEDGYLAACEIRKRKATIDKRTFTKKEILQSGAIDIRTGAPFKPEDLAKDEYTGKDFDDRLFIDLRTPKMCQDLFRQLCENGGPEQKVIIFCTREIHADRVAQQMGNLYVEWCQENGKEPKEDYAFKCMGGPNGGSEMVEPMRGSGQRAFIACTVDLLEAGVDIERLNAVAFFRYLKSSIKFYQMVGRGTRIDKPTGKYKFWLYDYTGVTELFGTDFITKPPSPGGGGNGGGEGPGGEGPGGGGDPAAVAEMQGDTDVVGDGNYILSYRDGREVPIPVEEYRREMIQRILSEAKNLNEFRQLWIESKRRQQLIDHLVGSNYNPDRLRQMEQMNEFDHYDLFAHHGYHARALPRDARSLAYLEDNQDWFAAMDADAAYVLQALAHQFRIDGTEALESESLWHVPDIAAHGGFAALKKVGQPADVIKEAKGRIFAA